MTIQLFGLLLCLVFSSVAYTADESAVFSYQLAPAEFPKEKLTVTVVSIPESQEDRILQELIKKQSSNPSANRLLVMHRNNSIVGKLGSDTESRHGISVLALPADLELDARHMHAQSSARDIASEFTLRGVKRAATWVGLSSAAGFSVMFFFTSDYGHAAAAATLAGALNLIVRPQVFWHILNTGGEAAKKVVRFTGASKLADHKLIHETGKIAAGYIFNVLTSGAFIFALNFGHIMESFPTYAELARNVAITAAFALYSGNTWDLFFSKVEDKAKKIGDVATQKSMYVLSYGRQLLGATLGSLMFIDVTRPAGMVLLGTIGTVGLIAMLHGDPFIKLADRLTSRLQKSPTLDAALSWLPKRGLFNYGSMCRALFEPM